MTISNKNIVLRIFLDILLFVGLFAFPFWVQVVLAVVGLIYFRNYFEFILIFMMSDFLYAIPERRFGSSVFALTLGSVIIFLAVNFLKKKLWLAR